jgi:hypothetical protein
MITVTGFIRSMGSRLSVFTVVVFLMCTIGCQSVDEKQAVLNCFAAYKSAILESNGEEALKWVDSHTLEYYDKILHSAIHDDSLAVDQMGILDKMTVLIVRHRVPRKEVLEMNKNSFFIYAIDQGMVGKNSVMNIEIDDIEVDGRFAKGRLYSNGVKSPAFFEFNKEGGKWKVDITSVFAPSITGFKQAVANSGQSENDFIMTTLEYMTGEVPGNGVWKPMD